MSLLTVIPDLIAAAVSSLEDIGAQLTSANVTSAAQTTAVAAAAGDEISVAIAAYFSQHAQDFQALSATADAFHDKFVQALRNAGSSYASADAANAAPLRVPMQDPVSAPIQTLARPLIGNPADGMLSRLAGTGGPSPGNFGTGGLLFPMAGGAGQVVGGGSEEKFARRSFGQPAEPATAARDTAAAGRDAARGPETQQSDRRAEHRSGHAIVGPLTIVRPDTKANGAERRVWEALADQLQPKDLVIVGQRITDHLKDHEIDFIVAIEGAGIACLEVKGGEVWHDGNSWWQRRRKKNVRISPVRQAREACYALRDFVERDPRWTRGRLRWDHIVVLPHTDVPQDFALPDCPRWKVVDRTQLPSLGRRLRNVLVNQELERPMLDRTGIHQLQTALGGRGGFPGPKAGANSREDEDAVA